PVSGARLRHCGRLPKGWRGRLRADPVRVGTWLMPMRCVGLAETTRRRFQRRRAHSRADEPRQCHIAVVRTTTTSHRRGCGCRRQPWGARRQRTGGGGGRGPPREGGGGGGEPGGGGGRGAWRGRGGRVGG